MTDQDDARRALGGREDAQDPGLVAVVALRVASAHARFADEALELAQRPALHHVVAVGGVLPDDGVARPPVVAGLGVEPVDVAGPAWRSSSTHDSEAW